MSNDDHWIKVNQELAKLVVLATLQPIEPDFDFTISYNNIWDTWNYGNLNGVCRLVNERRHGMITNEEARKAIEKYQKEHPLHSSMIDVTNISSKEGADIISQTIEQVAKKVDEDTELWCICEMAKMYMQGVRPVYPVRQKGKWIKITKDGITPIEYICNNCGRTVKSYNAEYWIEKEYPFCHCGADMQKEGD